MRREYGLRLVRAEPTIGAALVDRNERRFFGMRSPPAMLRMKWVTRTYLGNVAKHVASVYRGETYKVHVWLQAANRK